MTDIKVPQLGESVTEAIIAKWLKAEGDMVAMDEPLVELETDKVTLEVNAPEAGVLVSISAPEGETVEVGALLGAMGEAGDAPAPKAAKKDDVILNDSEESQKPKEDSSQATPPQNDKSAELSPAVRKLINDNNLDASAITGTGKEGRIIKDDVLKFIESGVAVAPVAAAAPSVTAPTPSAPRETKEREERVKMTKLRQTIAKRLKEAQTEAAILPAVNAEIDGDHMVYKNFYDIGVAVSTPQGLVVPVVRDADQKSFADIEKNIGDMAGRARDGKLGMDEMMGGTFTITNGGVFGSMMSTPILNRPQSAILGMQMMYVALSYDHRVIDGRESVSFLVKIKEILEDPARLLIEA